MALPAIPIAPGTSRTERSLTGLVLAAFVQAAARLVAGAGATAPITYIRDLGRPCAEVSRNSPAAPKRPIATVS